jgi:urease accessory protein
MAADAAKQRGDLPVVFTSLTAPDGIDPVTAWVTGRLTAWRAGAAA